MSANATKPRGVPGYAHLFLPLKLAGAGLIPSIGVFSERKQHDKTISLSRLNITQKKHVFLSNASMATGRKVLARC